MESFVVTSMTADSIKEALPQIMEQMQEKHGGIFAVMIDGAADMVLGINEDKECAALVHELHQLAIRFDCPIISVVHSNEGMQAGNAARGWLGRQFMRKAESNIILEISNGVTSVYGEQMRGAPIPKSQAICFQWSDEHMMHVSAAGAAEARMQQKQDGLRELAEEVFEGGNKPLSYRELIEAIRGANSCSVRTAKTRCKELGDAKIISKSMGVYTLAQ